MVLNIKKLRILALFAAVFTFGAISSSNANAASTFDTYTDGDGVVWDRETTDDGDVYIGIQSVPSGITTVNVPSINDVASGKDTYFLDSICSRYTTPDCSGVVSDTANVTKLDMTNTSKIQIKNVSQMFDTNHEVELVFGENVVIADPTGVNITTTHKEIRSSTEYEHEYSFVEVNGTTIDPLANPYEGVAGAFEGMKVKLTNLSNVKYIGWNAFKDTTLNANSRAITINNNQTIGGYIFAGSNVESASVDTAEVGQGFCRDCTSLTSLTIGNNVTKLYGSAFEGTTALDQTFNSNNITEVGARAFKGSAISSVSFGDALEVIEYEAFTNTDLGSVVLGNNVTTVKNSAFRNAGLTEIDLKNVERIDTLAFSMNNIEEVYLPKSINNLKGATLYYRFVDDESQETYESFESVAGIFGDNNLKKVTIAYDMFTDDTAVTYAPVFGCSMPYTGGPSAACTVDPAYTIEELVFVAPYGANDTVPANRVSGTYAGDSRILAESKNVINSAAFYNFQNLKKITIGEGYEYILQDAFFRYGPYREAHGSFEELNLPSTLRAIDRDAFAGLIHGGTTTINELPQNLERIDSGAFCGDYGLTINKIDLPKLKYIGDGAFMTVTVKELALRDKMEYLGNSSFYASRGGLQKVTIDFDIYGRMNSNRSAGLYNAFNWQSAGDLRQWSFSNTYQGFEWEETERDGGYYYPWYYDNDEGIITSSWHLGEIVFTEKAVQMSRIEFQGLNADKLDLSATPWEVFDQSTSYGNTFYGTQLGELKLPHGLKKINYNNFFYGARIEEPLVLPETMEEIGNYTFFAHYSADTNLGVNITSLPQSLKKIGMGAFNNDKYMTADVDLPNLEYLGSAAFQNTNVRDIVLHDSITTLGGSAFEHTPSVRNVTIDLDIYDTSKVTRTFGNSGDYYNKFVTNFGDGTNKFGTITFTEKAGRPTIATQGAAYYMPCDQFVDCPKELSYFYGIKADKIDLSATNWPITGRAMFQDAEVGELLLPHALETIGPDTFFNINEAAADPDSGVEPVSITIPNTLKTIDVEGFEYARALISGLPEGLTTINEAAFYGADVADDIVIPSTVTYMGQSAFNAGPEDVEYNTVTIKPNLDMTKTENQLIFQLFWNAKINDKLIIASGELPATNLTIADDETMPEFHGMTMKEVVITNLPKITAQAFEECANLEKVDLSSDSHLRAIDTKAFYNDTKLGTILFSPSIKNEVVTVGPLAFKGTAFRTMGDSTKQFDLTAAKFDASEGYAFSEMPKLETVDVPRTFTNATVPVSTFMNDGELRLATIDYKVTLIDDGAFSEDNKLESIFIWGDTEIVDSTLAGHGASTDGENGIYADPTDQGRGADRGPTIPEGTDIYAYSTSPAEEYAALPVRDTFEGEFYPLDEVLYLTSNKPTVLINDDATDFDKSDLIVYAMRRDGIILESDEWATYDDNAYPRSTSSIDFEAMSQAIQENPVFASIHDTPVPMDELDITTNVNFENIDFAMVPDPDDSTVRKIVLLYNDKYTDNLADTDIIPYQEGGEVEPPVPDTGANKIASSIAVVSLPAATMAVVSLLAGVLIYRKRRS